jgi:hypothetical protein
VIVNKDNIVLQVTLFLVALPLNLGWEVAQIMAYDFPETNLMTVVIHCFVPSLGDGLMTLMIYWTGWLLFRDWQWILHPGTSGYLLMMGVGLILAVLVEWNALYRTGAWGYNERMITIPFLGVGLLPLLQMMILPTAKILLLPLFWKKRGQTV